MPSGVKNYYYYCVHTANSELCDDNKLLTIYFRTAEQAGDYIGISKASVFNMLRNPSAVKSSKHYVIERCKVPMYEKVEVENIILS
jgi:hypothetical protein